MEITMDPRPPVSFGPFDAAAIEAEHARAAAGAAFSSVRCQATILIAAIMSLGLAGSLFWVQLTPPQRGAGRLRGGVRR